MIRQIIELLNSDEYIDACHDIQIAKGINKVPKKFKEILTQVKRAKTLKR